MEEEYRKLLKSGMFWKFYPELTGNYTFDLDKWNQIYIELITNRMKQKLEYEKIESGEDSLRHLKVEPKVSLNLGQVIDRRIEPKPILVLYLDIRGVEIQEAFDFAQKQMEKFREHGWLYLIIPIDDGRTTFIESHYIEKSNTIEFQNLQETILKEIKGK